MASHSGRKLRGGLTGNGDRQPKARQFGDRLAVNNRQITKRPMTFTTRQKEESILAAPLENSDAVVNSISTASKSSTASRRNKRHKASDENPDNSAKKADSICENTAVVSHSKTPLEDSIAKLQTLPPKPSTARRRNKPHKTSDENQDISAKKADSVCENMAVVSHSKTPLEDSVAKLQTLPPKSSTARRRNKPHKTSDENQDISAEKADFVIGNPSAIALSKTLLEEAKVILEDSIAKSRTTVPKLSTARRTKKRHETVDKNIGVPTQPADSSCESNVAVVRSKTTQITPNTVSVVRVLNDRDGPSSDMPSMEEHEETCNDVASINPSTSEHDQRSMNISVRAAQQNTLASSVKVINQRKVLQENNLVRIPSPKEGNYETLGSKLDANGEAGTSKNRVRIGRELSGLTRSVFKQPLRNQRAENGSNLQNSIHHISSSDDCSSSKASRALTRSARTKHVTEGGAQASRSKSTVNSRKLSNKTRTEVSSSSMTSGVGKKILSHEKTNKRSRLTKSSDVCHLSGKSSHKPPKTKTRHSQLQQTILVPSQQNISVCASDFTEPSDPASKLAFNSIVSVHNPEISQKTSQDNIPRCTMSVNADKTSSDARQSTTVEYHVHRPPMSINGEHQSTDDEVFVPESSKSKDGRKNANTRKQPNLSDDEDDDDVNGPSTARPKRRKLPATAEVDLLLPILKESVDNVLNDMRSNKQAKKVLKDMAKRVVTSVEHKISEKSAMQRLKITMSQIKSQEMAQRRQLLKKRQELARMEEERAALDEKLKKEQTILSITKYLLELRSAARQITSVSDP